MGSVGEVVQDLDTTEEQMSQAQPKEQFMLHFLRQKIKKVQEEINMKDQQLLDQGAFYESKKEAEL